MRRFRFLRAEGSGICFWGMSWSRLKGKKMENKSFAGEGEGLWIVVGGRATSAGAAWVKGVRENRRPDTLNGRFLTNITD